MEKIKNCLDMYPCCVCTLKECTAPNCPAANGQEDEYLARLEALLEQEIPLLIRAKQNFPPTLEEVIDIVVQVEEG
ncbi:MAG: hypothetical protein RBT33_01870 [Candidatus Dojkabacteria bacterium]|nr:hypothetical protein [Candidatus Dojkabacteria bacterium]